ncbi:hypothetical protein COOONC_22881 [Cooperia oncophora]
MFSVTSTIASAKTIWERQTRLESNAADRLRELFIQKYVICGAPSSTKNFFKIIGNFNSALAMASMGAQDAARTVTGFMAKYTIAWGLFIPTMENRSVRQICFLDTELAAQQRLGNARITDCDSGLMRFLSELLPNIAVYAQSSKMMSEVEQAELAAAALKRRSILEKTTMFHRKGVYPYI